MLSEPGIFVTGTDTGCGKTVVAAALALAARSQGRSVAPLKPAQTGDNGTIVPDAQFVQMALGSDEPYETVCPYRLRVPLAPAVAGEIEGVRLDPRVVVDAYEALRERYDYVVVEGAGGLSVPFSRGVDMADLATMLGLPVIVVVRPSLGTLNHTTLTLDAAHRRGLRVLGVVMSGYPSDPGLDALTNPRELARLSPVPLLGVLPFDDEIDTEGGRLGRIVEDGPRALDPLLGGTFSPSRFRRETERRLAAAIAELG